MFITQLWVTGLPKNCQVELGIDEKHVSLLPIIQIKPKYKECHLAVACHFIDPERVECLTCVGYLGGARVVVCGVQITINMLGCKDCAYFVNKDIFRAERPVWDHG